MLKRNLPQNLNDLRSGCISPKKFIKYQHVTNDLIKRLKLTKELVGHNGCVNCLEWNETGELLASGSDDTHLMIWDSFNYRRIADIDTFHKGNIFSVKFMPKFNNAKLASGAGDSCVKVIDISQETIIDNYSCHQNRVKRLAVSYNDPYLLWSCSEDGTIRQFDIRENTNSQNSVQSNNVLINLNSHTGSGCEVKCLAINPVRSDQLAVGSNDQYIRLYDRRKLSLKCYQNYDKKNKGLYNKISNGTTPLSLNDDDMKSIPDDAVQYYVPSHIPWNNQTDKYMQYTCTYLTFSPDGNSLLVNMGSEQVYLYDVNKSRPSFSFQSSLAKYVSTCNCDLLCDYSDARKLSNDIKSPINYTTNLSDVDKESGVEMLPHLNILKDQGNQMYKNSEYHSAITYYNTALQQGGHIYARFYANRAAAYISRNWAGDIYAALQDSIKALEIDYFHIKSHFRISQCLFQLNMIAEANDYIKYFQFMFPDEAKKIKQVGELEKKIVDKIADIVNKEYNENSKGNPANGSKHNNRDSTINILQAIEKHMKTQRFLEKKSLGEQELRWRMQSNDYTNRFCGHCNTTTDIKEANFFGINGQYIMAGSDEGNIFFWDRSNENIISVVCGDRNIVNCLQPHPTICFLASSGIDSVIRLWSPSYDETCETSDDEINKIGTGQNVIKAAQCNQKRIKSDPIENMLRNWGYHSIFSHNSDENEDGNDADDGEDNHDASDTTPRRGSNRRRIHFENTEYCRTS